MVFRTVTIEICTIMKTYLFQIMEGVLEIIGLVDITRFSNELFLQTF